MEIKNIVRVGAITLLAGAALTFSLAFKDLAKDSLVATKMSSLETREKQWKEEEKAMRKNLEREYSQKTQAAEEEILGRVEAVSNKLSTLLMSASNDYNTVLSKLNDKINQAQIDQTNALSLASSNYSHQVGETNSFWSNRVYLLEQQNSNKLAQVISNSFGLTNRIAQLEQIVYGIFPNLALNSGTNEVSSTLTPIEKKLYLNAALEVKLLEDPRNLEHLGSFNISNTTVNASLAKDKKYSAKAEGYGNPPAVVQTTDSYIILERRQGSNQVDVNVYFQPNQDQISSMLTNATPFRTVIFPKGSEVICANHQTKEVTRHNNGSKVYSATNEAACGKYTLSASNILSEFKNLYTEGIRMGQ